jgi:uncharacterized protein (DUF1810 family)
LTLFISAQSGSALYQQALDQFYSGEPDRKTLDLLGQQV